MRADVLVLRAGRASPLASHPYACDVPPCLAAEIEPGQLVALHSGDHTAVGIVWALDASDEVVAPAHDDGDAGRAELREIRDILLREPLLREPQRALAEWIAANFAAPLAAAARLFLPPGLSSGVRTVLRPQPAEPDVAHAETDERTDDAAALLGMLRERGRVERRDVDAALGSRRAQAAIGALLASDRVMQHAELEPRLEAARRVRQARLTGTPAALEKWRVEARARLDALPPTPTRRRPTWQSASTGERQAERILRQLAVLDLLSRARAEGDGIWSVDELQKLTRVTLPALDELAHEGLLSVETATLRHDPLAGQTLPRTVPLPLTPSQHDALDQILAPPTPEQDGRVVLLHGITGSGKTEVYLQALAAVIGGGRRGIVLVPEIALTPQAMARFAGRFPARVALLHSGLTDAERLDEWRRIRNGEVDVVLGSRSALFAPVVDLGLIVVDEEHEGAYKEERTPTYSAREAAVRLGRLTGATVVLGSATPSVESYWLATQGDYQLVELRERAPSGPDDKASTLPPVTIIDLRAELRAGNTSILSEPLARALRETLDRREQAILFLNRRGTASSVVCRECGYVARCSRCDVSMTFHAAEHALICHYCGHRESPPNACPVCGSASIRYFGLGTERVEAAVKRQFPAARVLRWDRDTARTRHAHEELLRAFTERRADVMVGTQMIAKGLDLPAVTLVGVVSADVALFLPDFRASERAFQLLTQVAGRAGRGAVAGRVLVQTFNPEHFCIQAAARHDYAGFFEAEIAGRRRYAYPPFRRIVKWTYEHAERYAAQVEATALAERLEMLIGDGTLADTDIVGPAPAFMERLRGRYRWQVLLRSPDPLPVLRTLAAEGLPRGWSVDVDPASTL